MGFRCQEVRQILYSWVKSLSHLWGSKYFPGDNIGPHTIDEYEHFLSLFWWLHIQTLLSQCFNQTLESNNIERDLALTY